MMTFITVSRYPVMGLMLLGFFVFLSSCTDTIGTIDNKAMNTVAKTCSTNEGIKEIYLRSGNYKAICSNNATLANSEDSPELHHSKVTGEEIASCMDLCFKNSGFEKMTTKHHCSKYGSGRYARCIENNDLVTCYCSNKITKTTQRAIVETK